MRTTLFIADLHLSEAQPEITAALLDFLQHKAPAADALYVLGDLFEYWIGDDEETPLQQQVAEAFLHLHQQGIPVYFIHGNRDFLLGEAYARRCRMILLPETAVIDLYGTPTLIAHGDTFCTDDEAYQRFRQRVHLPWLQWLFRRLPLSWRQRIGAKMRQQSSRHNQQKSASIMDVNADSVDNALRCAGVRRLIHGHTHRPHIHHWQLDGKPAERIVLGDWYQQGSMLRVSPDGVRLDALPFAPRDQ